MFSRPLLGRALLLGSPLRLGDALLLGATLGQPLCGRTLLGDSFVGGALFRGSLLGRVLLRRALRGRSLVLRTPLLLGDTFLLGALFCEALRGRTLFSGTLLSGTLLSGTLLGRALLSGTLLSSPLLRRPLLRRPRLLGESPGLLGLRRLLLGELQGLLLGGQGLGGALAREPRLVVRLGRSQDPGRRASGVDGGVACSGPSAAVTTGGRGGRHRRDRQDRRRHDRSSRRVTHGRPRYAHVESATLPGYGEGRVGVDSMVDRLGPVDGLLANLPARQGSFRPQRSLCAWRGTVGHEGGLEHVWGAFGVGVGRVAEK